MEGGEHRTVVPAVLQAEAGGCLSPSLRPRRGDKTLSLKKHINKYINNIYKCRYIYTPYIET